jgi:hypothetical protein
MKLRAQAREPDTRSLFKTIESFIKPAYVLRISRIFKARGLFHVDLLFQNTM